MPGGGIPLSGGVPAHGVKVTPEMAQKRPNRHGRLCLPLQAARYGYGCAGITSAEPSLPRAACAVTSGAGEAAVSGFKRAVTSWLAGVDWGGLPCRLLGHRFWEEVHVRRYVYRCRRCGMVSGEPGTEVQR